MPSIFDLYSTSVWKVFSLFLTYRVVCFISCVCSQQRMEEMQREVEKEQRILSHRIREVSGQVEKGRVLP